MSGRGCCGGRACWGGRACCGGCGGGVCSGGGGFRCGAGGRGPGSGRPGPDGYGWWSASAGRWSQGISDSFHRRCTVCHGDRSAGAFRAPGPGRLGGRPGPPGLPRSARVGMTTGSAARTDRREGAGPAGADPFPMLAAGRLRRLRARLRARRRAGGGLGYGAGGLAERFAGRRGRYRVRRGVVHALVPRDGRLARFGRGRREPLAGDVFFRFSFASAVCGLSAGPLAGERRNQPAGAATPGKSTSSLAGSASAGVTSGRSASGAAACGAIRPGGTDQDGTTWSGQAWPEVPARCGSSADPDP